MVFHFKHTLGTGISSNISGHFKEKCAMIDELRLLTNFEVIMFEIAHI